MFNFLKNPFEKLTAKNQDDIKEKQKEIKESLTGKDGVLGLVGDLVKHSKKSLKKLEDIHATIKSLSKKDTKGQKKELEKAGAASILMGKGMQTIVKAIKMYSKISNKTVDRFVIGIEKIGKAFKKLEGMIKTLKTSSRVLMDMAKGLIWFGLALIAAGPIYLLALPLAPIVIGVVLGVMWLFKRVLGDRKAMKGIRKGARALQSMGVAIALFGLALLVAGPIYMAAMSASLLIVLAVVGAAVGLMFLLAWAFKNGPDGNSIQDGIETLVWMGLGIIAFGVSLLAASYIYGYLWGQKKGEMLLIGVVIMAAVGVLVLLSKAKDNVYEGAKAMLVMSASIIVLGVGLWLFSKMFPANGQNWATLGLIGATVGGLTLVLRILGAAAKQVMMGAIALILASASLIVLGFGLNMFQKTVNKGYGWENFGLLMATIGGLAIEFGLIGLAFSFIAMGALAMGAIAGSLILLSYGLEKWRKVGFKENDAKDLQKAVVRLPMAFLGLTGDEGFLGALGKAAKTTAILAAASANALMMIGISTSLFSIGVGIDKFRKVTKGLDMDSFKNNVSGIVSTLAGVFGDIGNKFPGGKKSLFESVFGGGTQSAVAAGISSVMGMGDALTGIARGMQSMANLKFPTKYDKEGNPIEFETMSSDAPLKVAANAAMITDVLAGVFGKIGNDPKLGKGGKAGLFDKVFGSGGQSPVADGISSVMGMGDALTGIAKGVQSMADLKFPTKYDKEGKPVAWESINIEEKIKGVSKNVDLILLGGTDSNGLVSVFSNVGKANGPDKGWFTSTDYETGIDMIQNVGQPILSLAKGVQTMADLKFPTKYDKDGNPIAFTKVGNISKKLEQVESNIKTILLGKGSKSSGLVGIFKQLGNEDDGGWLSSSTIKKGGEIAKMIAEPIEAIANAATKLMKGKWDATNASERIKTLITALTSGNGASESILYAKAHLWKKAGESYENMGESIPNILNSVNKLKPKSVATFEIFADKANELAKSDKKIKNISESFSDISDSMGIFKDSVNDLDIELLSETRGLFEAMGVISESGSSDQIMAKYGKTLEETFKNLSDLLENFGGNVQQSTGQIEQSVAQQAEQQAGFFESLENQQKKKEQAPPSQVNNMSEVTSQLQEISDILRGTIKVKDTSGFFD